MSLALILLAAYLCGSLPIGLAIAKWVKGIDIREFGSGNIGATNVGRVIGKKWGLIVLLLDATKGALPTLLLPMAVDVTFQAHEEVACGLLTIVGHMFPLWLGFKGGKGVATALGVALVLSPWGMCAAFTTFVVVFYASRIVSLASMCGSAVYCITEMLLLRPSPFGEATWSRAAFAILVPALIVFRHRTNIARLLSGSEAKFSTPAEPLTPSEPASEPAPASDPDAS